MQLAEKKTDCSFISLTELVWNETRVVRWKKIFKSRNQVFKTFTSMRQDGTIIYTVSKQAAFIFWFVSERMANFNNFGMQHQ